jgi:hypothetical protein
MKFPNPHQRADEIGQALDQATAAKLRTNPALVEVAKNNLARWRAQEGGNLAPAHEEWERILRFLTVAELADFITSRTPKADRLRQSDPFAGILTEEERMQILHAHA